MNNILIIDSVCNKNGVINKDVNGGLGTRSQFGSGLLLKSLEYLKKKGCVLPLLDYAYLASILKNNNYKVNYIQVRNYNNFTLLHEYIVNNDIDIIVYCPSLVAYSNDILIGQYVNWKYPKIIQGVFGSFVSAMPEIFESYFKWVFVGEIETIRNYDLTKMSGIIKSEGFIDDLDSLPFPDWSIFPQKFSYKPILPKLPFFTMQSSRGCPMSCGYYCPYPTSQGKKWRYRSVDSIIEEIMYLKTDYKMNSILFRDAVFSLKKERTTKFGEKLISKNIKLDWACETIFKDLDKDLLILLQKAGLRAINIGIESENVEILKLNKRKSMEIVKQEELIRFCNKIGIKINGFFILGLEGDTELTINKTIDYATTLNLYAAQFTISTPLPGTQYYNEKQKDFINSNLEDFDNNTLVFRHDNFTPQQLNTLKSKAFKNFYFRPKFIFNHIKWKIRELLY